MRNGRYYFRPGATHRLLRKLVCLTRWVRRNLDIPNGSGVRFKDSIAHVVDPTCASVRLENLAPSRPHSSLSMRYRRRHHSVRSLLHQEKLHRTSEPPPLFWGLTHPCRSEHSECELCRRLREQQRSRRRTHPQKVCPSAPLLPLQNCTNNKIEERNVFVHFQMGGAYPTLQN